MTGIYSHPIQHPTQPENAMRAINGERPLCFDRPDFPPPMSSACKAWAVHPAEDPATESAPGAESWRCWGCRHLPQDPRVIARAKEAEEAPCASS